MKAKLSKELTWLLKCQAVRDYWDWGEWGRAEFAPFRVVRFLSKEKSERIQKQIAAKAAEWKEVLAKVPETKAYEDMNPPWGRKSVWGLDKQHYFNFPRFEENAIEERVLGRKLYVRALEEVTEGKRKKRVRPKETPEIAFGPEANSTIYPSGYCATCDRVKIRWDKERGQFEVAEYFYVGTSGMTQEEIRNRRTKNWPRAKFKAELQRKALAKAKELAAEGIEIKGIKPVKEHPWPGFIQGERRSEHNYYVDCAGPEIE